MLSLTWRKVLRDLWMNRTRTGLVILSIAVGVFAFAVIFGTRPKMTRDLPQSYLRGNPASATMTIAGFDNDLVEAITRMPEVEVAEGRRVLNGRVETGPGQWADIKLFAIDDFETVQVNRMFPETGAWPPQDRQLLIERSALFLTKADLGDTVRIETPAGVQREMPIVGLTHDLNLPPAPVFGIIFGYVTMDTLTWLDLPPTYNQLQFVVAENPGDQAHINRVADLVEQKVERSGREVIQTDIPTPLQHPAEEIIPTILLVLTTLGVLALVLSSFLVINTIMAILTQERRQIGVMKTIGANSGQIRSLYFRYALIFGACALLIAVPLGSLGAQGMSLFLADQLNFNLDGFVWEPQAIALAVLVGLLVPVLAAIYPVTSTARMTIREALTSHGLGRGVYGQNHLDRAMLKAQAHLPLSRPIQLSLRNTFRRKGRLIFTLITLVLGGAIFISVLTLRASLFQTLDDTLASQGFDVQIQFLRPQRSEDLQREIGTLPGVTALEGWGFTRGQPIRPDGSKSDELMIFAPPADTTLYQPEMFAGRWLTPEDTTAVVVHRNLLAGEPYLSLGSALNVDVSGETYTWQIVGITEEFQPPLGPVPIYLKQETYQHQLGQADRVDIVRLLTNRSDTLMAGDIEQHLAARDIQVLATRTASNDRAIFTERFNIITTILTILSFLMATVGGLGLMGTMSINVLERAREIGVMRAIGASTASVLSIVIVEGLMIGLLSWAGALIVAQPMSRFMSYEIGMALLGIPLHYRFSFLGLGIWLVMVIIISSLASYVPALNAANLSVRETLSYE